MGKIVEAFEKLSNDRRARAAAGMVIAIAVGLVPSNVGASVSYGYDQLGRVTSALYDNGLCIAYSYDQNGNRTAQTNTISGTPELAVWGSGVWGCFVWTP